MTESTTLLPVDTKSSDLVKSSIPEESGALSGSEADIYRSVSRAAICSVVLAIFGLFAFMIPQLLVLPFAGLVTGIVGRKAIQRYPAEFSGRLFANVGIAVCGFTLLAAPAYHGYIYATEVPEGYTRVSFYDFMSAKGQPDVPTNAALTWNGQRVFIKGYVHPTSMDTMVAKKFVLVPDLGTCCFGGQPPLTHMIEVNLNGSQYAHKNLRKKGLAGTFMVNPYLKPVDGLTGVYYQLQADVLK